MSDNSFFVIAKFCDPLFATSLSLTDVWAHLCLWHMGFSGNYGIEQNCNGAEWIMSNMYMHTNLESL
jgi:hypothetical protein